MLKYRNVVWGLFIAFCLSFGSFMATLLQPGDTVVIPQKLERTAWLRDIKDITQILANVALTAGTILVGLR